MNGPRSPALRGPHRTATLVAMGLAAAALVLLALAIVAVFSGGVRVAVGPIRVSASNPSRLLLEAAVLFVVSTLIGRASAVLTWTALMLVLVAGAVGSEPKRVGDGGEYIAMTLALSEARPPALTDAELTDTERMLDRLPAFANSDLAERSLLRNGRQDFYHFWLYPLTVAPFAALARAVGLPLSIPFTAANLLWLAALAAVLLRKAPPALAAIVVAGPVFWWVDKAHADAFVVSLVGIGLLLLRERPAWALLALAAAGTQMPAFAPLWVLAALDLLFIRRWRSPDAWGALAASAALLVLSPAYYLWRLGQASPLQGTTIDTWPGLRAWLTPIVDPNLGVIVYAPVVLGLAAIGLWRFGRAGFRRRREHAVDGYASDMASWVAIAGGLALLAGAALTPNVNHGGTPGISRYALWLIAILVPLAVEGARWLTARVPTLLLLVTIASIGGSAYAFEPRWPDRSRAPAPNLVATWLWAHVPSIDNPLPEVFAERMFQHDGAVVLPVATTACEKVLVAGEPGQVRWPVPCGPLDLPAECRADGALCYVNDQKAVIRAPRQPQFGWSADALGTWTATSAPRLESVIAPIGGRRRIVRAASDEARVRWTPGVRRTHVVQGTDGFAVWTDPVPDWTEGDPALVVRDEGPMHARFYDPVSLEPIGAPREVPAGDVTVPVPRQAPALIVVASR